MKTLSRTTLMVYLGPALIIMAVANLYPTISAIGLGFMDWQLGTPWDQARWNGLANFVEAWSRPAVWRSMGITLLFSAVVVGAEMLLGIALAILLEHKTRGIAVFRTIFIMPMMIAPVAVGLIWRYLFDTQFGMINAILGLLGQSPVPWLAQSGTAMMAIVIADIWQWTPFVFIMITAALANLDQSVLEAARMDGATPWQTLIRVKLPMILPVIAITLVMRLIDAFRVLEVIYIMTFGGPGNDTEILSLYIYKTAFVSQQLGIAAAVSVLLLAVVCLLSWLALRMTQRGGRQA